MTLKLAQLAALPLALLAVALTVTPRNPQRRAAASPWSYVPSARTDASPFVGGGAPTGPVDLSTVAAPAAPARGGWFQVTVVATLPDAATAAASAAELTALLRESAQHLEDPAHADARARLLDDVSPAPLTPAEAVAFERAGVGSTLGVGWPGASAEARDAVVVLGPVVIVPGLKGDFARLQPHPLAALLRTRGARVQVEGEPGGGRPPRVDLSCVAPDEAAAARLAEAVQDYLDAPATFTLRPPWHPAGVSAAEARARSSYARLSRAVREVLAASHEEFARRFDPYAPTDMEAALVDLLEAIRRRALEAIDEAGADGTHDPVVVGELRRAAPTLGPGLDLELADPGTRRRLAERMGALSLEVAAPEQTGATARLAPTPAELAYTARGRVRADGRRVELGGLAFHRIGRGLPALLVWLRAAHAADARITVVDVHAADGVERE